MSNRTIETLALSDLRSIEEEEREFFVRPMTAVLEACHGDVTSPEIFLLEDSYERLRDEVDQRPRQEFDPAPDTVQVSFRKIGKATYALRVAAEEPVLFRIKLSYFPGFELVQEGDWGERLPLYDALGSMIGVGNGEMILRYRRTWAMKLGYGISLATLLGVLVVGGRRRFRGWRRR